MYKKAAFEVPNFKFTFVPLQCKKKKAMCETCTGVKLKKGNDLGGKVNLTRLMEIPLSIVTIFHTRSTDYS